MARVAFIHAHPDDEAIFTGGTIATLAAAGHDVEVILATGGELGLSVGQESLAGRRQAEARQSCALLGVAPASVHFLANEDSGMRGENPAGLVHKPIEPVAQRCIDILDAPVDAVVGYDSFGIYGHPDHIAVHRLTTCMSERHRAVHGTPPVRYDATVDREYLHFVETHVVVDASGGRPTGQGLASTRLGSATLEIDLTVDVHPVLDAKRAAMAAHQSQLPADAPLFELGRANFDAVYGFEWYRRTGPPGPLDELSSGTSR